MTEFCSLHISSDIQAALPSGFLRTPGNVNLVFIDNESAERRASFKRLRKKGVFRQTAALRYHWSFSSEGFVHGFDVMEHVTWVLDQVQPGFLLSKLKDSGYRSWLQFYWEGNGTGGGPDITPEIAAVLVQHKVNLLFGFY